MATNKNHGLPVFYHDPETIEEVAITVAGHIDYIRRAIEEEDWAEFSEILWSLDRYTTGLSDRLDSTDFSDMESILSKLEGINR